MDMVSCDVGEAVSILLATMYGILSIISFTMIVVDSTLAYRKELRAQKLGLSQGQLHEPLLGRPMSTILGAGGGSSTGQGALEEGVDGGSPQDTATSSSSATTTATGTFAADSTTGSNSSYHRGVHGPVVFNAGPRNGATAPKSMSNLSLEILEAQRRQLSGSSPARVKPALWFYHTFVSLVQIMRWSCLIHCATGVGFFVVNMMVDRCSEGVSSYAYKENSLAPGIILGISYRWLFYMVSHLWLRLSYKLGTLSKSWFRLAVIMIVILGISSSTTFAVWLSNIHSSSGQNAPQWILTGIDLFWCALGFLLMVMILCPICCRGSRLRSAPLKLATTRNALTFGIVTSMLVAQTILRNVAVEIGNAFALWFFSVVDFFPFLLCTILYYNKDLGQSDPELLRRVFSDDALDEHLTSRLLSQDDSTLVPLPESWSHSSESSFSPQPNSAARRADAAARTSSRTSGKSPTSMMSTESTPAPAPLRGSGSGGPPAVAGTGAVAPGVGQGGAFKGRGLVPPRLLNTGGVMRDRSWPQPVRGARQRPKDTEDEVTFTDVRTEGLNSDEETSALFGMSIAETGDADTGAETDEDGLEDGLVERGKFEDESLASDVSDEEGSLPPLLPASITRVHRRIHSGGSSANAPSSPPDAAVTSVLPPLQDSSFSEDLMPGVHRLTRKGSTRRRSSLRHSSPAVSSDLSPHQDGDFSHAPHQQQQQQQQQQYQQQQHSSPAQYSPPEPDL